MRLSLLLPALIALFLAPASAFAWADNFDSYANGSALHGQGGWLGWNGDASATSFVTNLRSRSAPHSNEIRPTSDIVQQYVGVNSGLWIVTGYSYVTSGITGDQYLILLNTYPAGPSNNWSTQVLLDMTANVVRDADDANSPTLPLVRNAWIQVRVEIDFSLDIQRVYYNNAFLKQESWTAGTAPGGALRLQALDLFSNAAPAIHWDDCSVLGGATPVESTTWGRVKTIFNN